MPTALADIGADADIGAVVEGSALGDTEMAGVSVGAIETDAEGVVLCEGEVVADTAIVQLSYPETDAVPDPVSDTLNVSRLLGLGEMKVVAVSAGLEDVDILSVESVDADIDTDADMDGDSEDEADPDTLSAWEIDTIADALGVTGCVALGPVVAVEHADPIPVPVGMADKVAERLSIGVPDTDASADGDPLSTAVLETETCADLDPLEAAVEDLLA